jgi:hypothetical protein
VADEMTETSQQEDRYVFVGRVHPERYGPHIEPDLPEFSAGGLRFRLSLHHAQLVVEVLGSHSGTLLDLKNMVVDLAQLMLNAVGFVAAAAFNVEVVSCLDPRGEVHVFNTAFDGLRADGDISEDESGVFQLLWKAGAKSIAVRLAMADLNRAIQSPGDTLFYCYRAMESIRQRYQPAGGDDDAASWKAMRAATGTGEVDARWLGKVANVRRHGAFADVTEDDRRRALVLTRATVLAYARLVLAGDDT